MSYRIIFLLAGTYNIVFGSWLFFSAERVFGLVDSPVPLADFYMKMVALLIIFFSLLYFYAAIQPVYAKRLIILGLISKIVPGVILFYLVQYEGWSWKLYYLVIVNDGIWWIPFYRFITRKKKIKATRRAVV